MEKIFNVFAVVASIVLVVVGVALIYYNYTAWGDVGFIYVNATIYILGGSFFVGYYGRYLRNK